MPDLGYELPEFLVKMDPSRLIIILAYMVFSVLDNFPQQFMTDVAAKLYQQHFR